MIGVDARSARATTIFVLLVASCASHSGSSEPIPTTTQASAPEITATTTAQNLGGSLDLHTVDWSNIAVPGASCFRAHDIRLHNGRALLRDDTRGNPTKPGSNGVRYDDLELGRVTYGDFDGDGHDDAAVPLDCNNNGGTADGLLLDSFAVYSGHTGKPTYLGLITPQHQPKHVLPTLPNIASIRPGTIVVSEYWYGPNDMTCCPSGRATTRWSLSAGKIVLVATRVTASPK